MMKLGIIGCGKMGQALLQGVLDSLLCAPKDVVVYDSFAPAVKSAVEKFGVTAAAGNPEVATNADAVLLAVKPQDLLPMLAGLADPGASRLFISIAAGVRIGAIENALSSGDRVIRVMPNTPALVGKGASAFALGSRATEKDAALAETILGAVGYVVRVDEYLLDAVTAVSGSGPAYIFAMIESMVAGGVDQGLDEKTALALAAHTVAGAAELLLHTGESPSALRENVTSPKGTTFAALESMRANDFDRIVREAIAAAKRRSVELGA